MIGPLEERVAAQRRPIRFVAFALAVVIGVTVLLVRLAYMQLVSGSQYAQHTDSKDRKSTRLNSSHIQKSRMPSSA